MNSGLLKKKEAINLSLMSHENGAYLLFEGMTLLLK